MLKNNLKALIIENIKTKQKTFVILHCLIENYPYVLFPVLT